MDIEVERNLAMDLGNVVGIDVADNFEAFDIVQALVSPEALQAARNILSFVVACQNIVAKFIGELRLAEPKVKFGLGPGTSRRRICEAGPAAHPPLEDPDSLTIVYIENALIRCLQRPNDVSVIFCDSF